jgi:hypothetical protein
MRRKKNAHQHISSAQSNLMSKLGRAVIYIIWKKEERDIASHAEKVYAC